MAMLQTYLVSGYMPLCMTRDPVRMFRGCLAPIARDATWRFVAHRLTPPGPACLFFHIFILCEITEPFLEESPCDNLQLLPLATVLATGNHRCRFHCCQVFRMDPTLFKSYDLCENTSYGEVHASHPFTNSSRS